MKKYFIIIVCLLLCSCSGNISHEKGYKIITRTLNSDNTYTYSIDNAFWINNRSNITADKKYDIGDLIKFETSIFDFESPKH